MRFQSARPEFPAPRIVPGHWHQRWSPAEAHRHRILQESVQGGIALDAAIDRLDALRWLRRVSYHMWRLAVYLSPEASEPR